MSAHSSRLHLVPVLALGPFALALGAQTRLWSVDVPGAGTGYGERFAVPGDVDGDGALDVVAVPDGANGARVQSGRTGAFLRTDAVGALLPGVGVFALGDVDGDGVGELGYVTAAGLQVRDGRTGSQRRVEAHPAGQPGLGQVWAARVGDVDADGVADHVISYASDYLGATGALIEAGSGFVQLRSGATGAPIATPGTAASIPAYGGYCAGVGDATGDGVPDFVVTAGVVGPADVPGVAFTDLMVHSGATGAIVWSVPSTLFGAGLELRVAAVGDVDSDGLDDFVVANPAAPSLVTVSGFGTQVLATFASPLLAFQYHPEPRLLFEAREHTALAVVPDVDADGVDDVWVGTRMPRLARPAGGFVVLGPGVARLHSGRTLAPIREFVGDGWSEEFGAGLAALGDVDGDGAGDLLVGVAEPRFGASELRAFSGSATVAAPIRSCVGSYRGPLGTTPSIGSTGSTSVAAQSFRLRLQDAQPSVFALAYAGPASAFAVSQANLAGPLVLCVGGPLTRLPGIVTTNAAASVELSVALGGATLFQPGTTWTMQWVFRSFIQPFERSDALTVTFVP